MPDSTIDNSEKLKATQILKLIPEFHGRVNENIHEFLDAVDEGISLVKEGEEKILLSFLRTKLKGSAFKAIQYLSVETWAHLKEHLQRRFGVGDTIQYIEKEFTLLTQGHKETVAEFGERTCTLAAKITEYNIREKKYDSDTFQKIMEDRVLVQFVTGLKEPVRFQLKTYRCTSYQEALGIACHLEKETHTQKHFDARSFVKNMGLKDQGHYSNKPNCFNCGKPGHKSRDCYSRTTKRSNQPDTHVKVVQCYNCQKMGHIAKDCRSRPQKRFEKPHYSNKTVENEQQGNDSRLPAMNRAGRPASHFKSVQ